MDVRIYTDGIKAKGKVRRYIYGGSQINWRKIYVTNRIIITKNIIIYECNQSSIPQTMGIFN